MAEVTRARLRAAVTIVIDLAAESEEPAVRLSRVVLEESAEAAMREPNTRRVADLSFALTDFRAAVDELPYGERSALDAPLRELSAIVDELRRRTALSPSLIEHLTHLRKRVETRRAAVARQGFHPPGTTPPPLPHPPEELARDAAPLRDALRTSGFDTPALDLLIDSPAAVYMSELSNIADELEVITDSSS